MKRLLAVALLFAPVLLSSQSLYVGAVPLALGMSKASALRTLQKAGYTVDSVDGFVFEHTPGSLYHMIGGVGFTANRLSFISRDWTPRQFTEADLGQAIMGALRTLTHSDAVEMCRIHNTGGEAPGVVGQSFSISCGAGHTVLLSFVRDSEHLPGGSLTIQERLGWADPMTPR